MFLITTAINIRVFLKRQDKKLGKPGIKNTISFKSLNILYGIGLILESIVHLILIQINTKDTFIVQYDITMAFNLMLLIFLVSNDDAMKFLYSKFISLKEEQKFKFRHINCVKKRNRVGQLPMVSESANMYASASEGTASHCCGSLITERKQC